MEKQIRALRRRIEEMPRDTRGHRRYGDDLRNDVIEYVLRREEDGQSQAGAARELGLPQKAVWAWMRSARDRPASVMKPVAIVDDAPETKMTVVLPGGSRVEGLEIEDVVALVRGLS